MDGSSGTATRAPRTKSATAFPSAAWVRRSLSTSEEVKKTADPRVVASVIANSGRRILALSGSRAQADRVGLSGDAVARASAGAPSSTTFRPIYEPNLTVPRVTQASCEP